ncbi:MAG: ChaN family lipoprotein [Gammaproteobacteria bacterium]|nr:ChaN family lipoprotein [Gammaproteobacteria bacterium]
MSSTGQALQKRKGAWKFISTAELAPTLRNQQVVLLGEQHDIAEHHRWQLQTVSALFALNNELVLGFEMFPRRVQPALDKWVAGELNEAEFLNQSDWDKVWGYDAALYMPLFHFARINKIPMLALNIDRSVVRIASKKGLNKMSIDERQGVSLPAPASADYLKLLANTFNGHGHPKTTTGHISVEATLKNEHFLRFVGAQQLWDRAMAEQLANAVLTNTVKSKNGQSTTSKLVIGIMGTGHIIERFGVPQQLADLGISKTQVLLPGNSDTPCAEITARTADAVFILPTYEELAPAIKPLLGVHLLNEQGAIKISQIVEKSIAEQSGLKQGDTFIRLAGKTIGSVNDVINTVQAMPAGTWLPITIERDGKSLELVAKFSIEDSEQSH